MGTLGVREVSLCSGRQGLGLHDLVGHVKLLGFPFGKMGATEDSVAAPL